MNDFITSLFNHVTEETRIPVSETNCKLNRMDKLYEKLTSRLNDEEIKLLEDYVSLSENVRCDFECQAFANGIKTAVHIFSCVLSDY